MLRRRGRVAAPRAAAGADARDLALLMMEACRSLGFAARFVSGHLCDAAMVDADRPMIGGGATHAWCQVCLPAAGWWTGDLAA
ncbi:transglutaminase family protein [Elioraea sp. Yellowstone]|uniref:transglutaminase-like domain-containing protein n=1 Tax=Elioraea sp. Yellowstone TaxID=2592070 RepID=UPI002104E6AB|nr:transglutaminase family protein [Elioraea sp. Yellowstone]